ncbi:hypothetical protein FRB94_009928 [Tulasnella sp. JGI-2019a]|nr:hypothetical protein FRB93_006926 [Tulasnella sp. JGI-2019a]KAG8994390.1 hypothetical protein FRB94_009928 [Tulasnella sp. JGI-2019a]KAG9025363.1 hypothetical protein FRB95_010240 [Tulasnella sp. JGI-2019a]
MLMPSNVRHEQLQFLGKGRDGCVYNVLSGLPSKYGRLIAKTPYLSNGEINQDERQALLDNNQLVMDGRDLKGRNWKAGPKFGKKIAGDGRRYLLVLKHDGVPLRETSAFKEQFPLGYNTINTLATIQECESWMRRRYDIIADKWIQDIRRSYRIRKAMGEDRAWWQFDLNAENFFWNQDADKVSITE